MRPYRLRFAVSSNEALAKLPPRVEQLARITLRELAATRTLGNAPEGEGTLRIFEIPPYAFAYVVDRDLREVILERVYVVLRTDDAQVAGPRLIALGRTKPLRQ